MVVEAWMPSGYDAWSSIFALMWSPLLGLSAVLREMDAIPPLATLLSCQDMNAQVWGA